jgi:C1A family cysteine protease
MRSRSSILPILLATVLPACTGAAPDDIITGDDEASVSGYDDLMNGAPDNSTLPDDNKADAVYPKQFDLVADQSPVKSQGSRGVCSIFSTVALMENLYIKAGDPMPDFSEQYLQWSVKFEVGDFTMTSGSNAGSNLRAINEFGIPAEAGWPYESFPWSESNDAECTGEEDARPTKCHTNGAPPESAAASPRFKLPRGRWLNTNSIKAHLTTKKHGVIVGLDFFYQSWNHRRSTIPVNGEYWKKGYVTYPNADDVTESHTHRAGHSILIVGWDDELEVQERDKAGTLLTNADGTPKMEKGFYIFKNSWGTAGFGIDSPFGPGYGYLSMKYVHQYGSAYVSDVPTIAPPPAGDHFEASPNVAIPDNDPTGASSTITIPAGAAPSSLTVNVDIAHPYIGDLAVTLLHDGVAVRTLHSNSGGASDNILQSYSVTAAELGAAGRAGEWTLSVVDNAAQDVGTLETGSIDVR